MMNPNNNRYRLSVLVISTLALLVMIQRVNAQGFTIACGESQVTIEHGGELVTRYHFHDAAAQKPYFWPVIGPKGTSMTRAFPMETVDGEQHDHPHHRGVWFGHQGVAGTDTWLEAASKKGTGEEQQKFLAGLGTIAHLAFTEISATQQRATIRCRNDYLDSNGKRLLADERSMVFRKGANQQLVLDFDITLKAAYGDVELQDKKDAGLNVRVPTSMSLTHGKGHIINSSGDKDVAAWAKKADWVDYFGTVDGKQLGVAFLNHPTSFRYPTRWHVRDYGLFTANAFGPQSLDSNEPSGTFVLKNGEAIQLRHQLIFHEGDDKAAAIAEAFRAYAASKPNE